MPDLKPPSYTEHLTIFADLLGFEEAIGTADDSLRLSILKLLTDLAAPRADFFISSTPIETGGIQHVIRPAIRTFSDHIVISYDLERVYADSKYHNHALYGWVADNGFYDLDIVRRPKDAEGWVRLPIRWMVERTFAWLLKCRRLSVDREKSTRSAEAMIRLAMIHLMLNRLSPKEDQQEFRYREAA